VATLVQAVGVSPDDRVEYFISYAGPDRPWAEWVAWQLRRAGHKVELDVWDWLPGANFVLQVNDALVRAERVLMLWSNAYFERNRYTTDEWTAVMAERPDRRGQRRLVALRVEAVAPPPILGFLTSRDLFGLSETQAQVELLAAVGRSPRQQDQNPPFPGEIEPATGPRVPGSLPAVQNLPPRNPSFTGREGFLAALRRELTGGRRAWVQALHGLGGVGKTQLAIEYAYLFAGDYDYAWWIDAEQPQLIGEQLAAFATVAGWAPRDAATADAVRALRTSLGGIPRWLLVFDNTEDAVGLLEWLPQGPGHLIITSRSGAFHEVAVPVEVEVFSRGESITMLRNAVQRLTESEADRLAEELGDLPLALAQAVGLMATTGMTTAEYVTELQAHADRLLSAPAPPSYPRSLAAAITISMRRLADAEPAGVELLHLCARLAPEPIPIRWFLDAPKVLTGGLTGVATDVLSWRNMLGRVEERGLARLAGEAVQLHRLIQAVLRDQCSGARNRADQHHAEALVAAAEPENDGSDPGSWPAWAALLPHLLALDPATAGAGLRATACNAVWYLLSRGAYRTAVGYAEGWHEAWLASHGPDDLHRLRIANDLGSGYGHRGDYRRARHLHSEVLSRYRRVIGPDHPDTLSAANNLATDLDRLGQSDEAQALLEDTLGRYRNTLGPDHAYTLRTANTLGNVLSRRGDLAQARDLYRDTLDRRRKVFGPDHPDTLVSAHNLALALSALGYLKQARELLSDTLDRQRRILGPEHPLTLMSANALAGRQ
jgi:tetratricopeptide (TPR) repeat protein